MADPRTPLRFGVLTRDTRLSAWGVECIERLETAGHARLEAIIAPTAAPRAHEGRRQWLPRLLREHWVERRSRALRRVELGPRFSALPRIEVEATLSPASREALSERQLDFVLQFEPAPLPDELLDLPRFGVWAFCQGRRSAPCFWEVVEGRPKTRVALERLTRQGAADLFAGHFATCRASWVNNIDRALLGSSDFCVRVCAEIAHGGGERIRSSSGRQAPADEIPGNGDALRLLANSAACSLAKLWELLFHVEIWNVGFSNTSVDEIVREARVDAGDVTWCPAHKRGHFIADPFVYVENGETRVLVEDYDQIKGRIGRLVRANGGNGSHGGNGARRDLGGLELATEFDLPYHMSYPYIFEEGGVTYCIPETYQSRRVDLYRRTSDGWVLVRTLIDGLPAVDPTLFKHDGRYWLFFTLQNDGAWGNQKLYAYHAPALDAAWSAHALNPVKCDIGATRPAGSVFLTRGSLFRPSQDCSTTYGAAVVVNELIELSPTAFSEREVARIEPIAGGPYPNGFHTLNAMGGGAVFDSKVFAFDWLAWRKNWGRLHEVLR